MAERGEGIGTSGGSQSHTSVVPILSSTSRIRNPSVSFTVEAAGAKRNPLPLRKRKLPVIENPKDSSVKSSKELSVSNLPLSDPILPNINCELPSPACKRRRVTSESSAASSRDLCLLEESIFPKSTSKRKKSPINSTSKVGHRTPAKNSGSKRRNSLPVTKNIFSESSSSTSRRRSTRGSYFLGFYAEGEQQLLAAFRDHTCELKSPPQLSNISTSQRRQNTNSKRPTSSRSRKSITSSTKRSKTVCKKHSSRASGSKMTEGKPSYGTDQYKNLCKVKTLEDAAELPSSGVSKRGSRRHTLPGRAELARVDMGVALSKCTSPPNENHDGHSDAAAAASVDRPLTESRPSTSGLAAALDDGLVPSTSSASTVLHQLMRRLPRKKKSVSEQDLSHVDPSISSINAPLGHGSKKVERVSSSSFLKKHQDLSRRRSANTDQERTENSLIAEKGLDQLNEAEKGPISTFRSYPLRNRLRQREGDSPTPPSSGGVITANPTAVLNNSFPQASVTPTASADPSRYHLDPQSLSLPSSPSSPSSQGGVTILDAFRRLRDSRRMSQEQTQCAKDSKQSSVWKRGSSARRSPLSKRGSRNKSNSASNNSRVGTQSSLSSQLHFQMGLASSGANPIPLPPSSALSATSTASGLLPSSALSSLGAAIGGSGSSGGGTPSSGSSALGVGSLMAAAPGDSESEENEMGRLEALLASRGLPPSLFGALGPRMQHILHRSVSSSISSKAQQLLVGLQATGDESEQLQAVIEMCQLLVMGNEDTLAGFPIKQVTPALITLLNMEHNFDMMNHACRALTYMMEALPRSSSVVVDAVPAFLEKLQVIQCMDVAEQSLTALNMLSKKHSKAILHERGVSACLTYIDFFSSNAQRAALSITANCFQNLSADEFHFASDSLAILSSRLTTQGDKKCVESVCLAFSRLVDCFQTDSVKLQEIANHGLLTNTQQLLVMSPPVLSSGTFIMVIRMMSLMCTHCPELAVSLLKNNIAQTLCYLLTNYTEPPSEHVDLVPRSPQEMYEITCLIGELLPVLPSDGIFLIDSAISKPQGSSSGSLVWQWQDDRSQWHNYSQGDSRVIELAHQSGEDEISLCVNGNSYTLDFHSMQQINDNTGTMRSIVRRIVPLNASGISSVSLQVSDARAECLKEDTELATALIKSLFSLLYEVYSSSAGPAVRYKCLRALLRMIHFGRPELLQEVLKSQSVSSHLATMLSSVDLKIIVSALQMAALLMHKLPNVFSIYFRREGVMHQIKRLRDIEVALPSASAPVTPVATPKSKVGPASSASCPPSVSLPPPLSSGSSAVVVSVGSSSTLASSVYGCSLSSLLPSSSVTMSTALPPPPPLPGATAGSTVASAVYNGVDAASSLSIVSPPSTLMSPTAIGAVSDLPQVHGSNNSDEDKMASPHLRLPDVLKRRRQKPSSRSTPTSSGGSWRRGGVASRLVDDSGLVTPGPAPHSPTFSDFLLKNTGFSAGRDTWRAIGGGRSKMAGGSSTQSGSVGSSSSSSSSSGGKTTASSFLANFNPVRWGRCNSAPAHPHDLTTNHGKDKAGSMNSLSPSSTFSVSSVVTSPPSNSINREQIRIWVRDQAKKLCDQYFKVESQGSSHPALTVMNRLIAAIQLLDSTPERAIPALSEISVIVMESDISPFEVIHSDLVRSLLTYLATPNASKSPAPVPPSSSILSSFNAGESLLGVLAAAASMGSSSNGGGDATAADSTQVEAASTIPAAKIPRLERIRSFLHVFLGYSLDPMSVNGFDPHRVVAFGALVAKLNGCVNQLEQFPVKVHDLPGAVLTGSGRGGSTSAIKFFNTHQLKCNLLRHPECSRLKQWRGGPVKVDPLALVQAIERYLVIRGYGRLRDEDEDHSDEDNSDQDIDDTLAAVSVSQSSNSHKLQFLIGDRVLPYNMTVYQAVRQFAANEGSLDGEVDGEVPISHSSIWLQTHTIYYRPIQDDSSKPHSSRKGKGFSRPSPKKKSGESNSNSKCSLFGGGNAVLESQLTPKLPSNVTAKDPSLEVLALLRILHAVNRHCGSFYPSIQSPSPIAASEFINVKLAAKASRQLQDPLVIMTGNLPQWLPQIAYACPFVFPFETRQLLFYAVSFDRDRALQRLMDSAPELNSSDSSERVTPRLERRKRTVSREDILKQAETVIADLASSRAMLEIHYENEVGTGLGPTLEFYALVSRELQKADLELWRGDAVSPDGGSVDPTAKGTKYVVPGSGFYPLPLPKNIKSAHLTKIKAKFKFLGKFMAKAVMDSRMVDLNLHECVYKWLLSEEKSLCLSDIISMDPSLGQTLSKLQDVLLRKKKIQEEGKANGYTASQLQEKIETLTVDGCRVEDLCLNFTLPGFPNIELKKGGSDIEVNVSNIEQYMQSVLDWLLRDGVHRQLDAMREGFDSVFPSAQLRLFYPNELEQLFCGSVDATQWQAKQLADCIRPDHGYTHDSNAVKFLLQVLSEYSPSSQRAFLQFVTGSPRLPVGGFKSLSPPLTIVRKTFDASEDPDQFLPSVMTCVNYLKLPDYSSVDVMRDKLRIAYLEGQHSFHLS